MTELSDALLLEVAACLRSCPRVNNLLALGRQEEARGDLGGKPALVAARNRPAAGRLGLPRRLQAVKHTCELELL